MIKYKLIYLQLIMLLLLTACSTGFHGSFIANTYTDEPSKMSRTAKGLASGNSCQTRIPYLFPKGEPPSTQYYGGWNSILITAI